MNEHPLPPSADSAEPTGRPPVRSLKELIEMVSGKSTPAGEQAEPSGLAEVLPFPFLAIVGQSEMKLALLLALINPAIGGVLLIGPRGTGKTTAVRGLLDLLPLVERSACYYGCMPEDVDAGGMDAVCPECAAKFGSGIPLTIMEQTRMVELPLNARLEDVIGGLDERAVLHERMRLKRGLLAQADKNLLYLDEANLLADEIVDAILDAAAQGTYTVRRGPMSSTYWARFTLIGSMNPEEGNLRPQIMDRFGLRVVVRGLDEPARRLEAYRRVMAYRENPHPIIAEYADSTRLAREEIQNARALLPKVTLSAEVARAGIQLIHRLGIASLRAEISLFEAARAFAAAASRTEVTMDDLRAVFPMALRLRRSAFITQYVQAQSSEDDEMDTALNDILNPAPPLISTPLDMD